MVERAASRHRSVKPAAANGGGPKGQALQTGDGEQTIEPAIGQRAERRLRRFAVRQAVRRFCTHRQNCPPLILIDATAMRIARRKRWPLSSKSREFCLEFWPVLGRAAPDRRSAIAIRLCRYRKAGTAPIPTWQFASAPCPTPCRSTNAGASSHPGGIASTASS